MTELDDSLRRLARHLHGAATASDAAASAVSRLETTNSVAAAIADHLATGNPHGQYVLLTALAELVDDRVAALLQAGANVTLTYNDVAGTLTIAASGGGGGGSLTIEEADGSPSVSGATKLILPSGTLSASGTEATYTPAGGGGQGCRVWRSSNQSIATATDTAISFDTERDDTDSMWSSSPNPTRIEIVTTGVYAFGAGIAFATNGSGVRVAQIRRSGATTLAYDQRPASSGGEIIMTLSSRAALSAGDYLELIVYQDSGGSLNVRSYNDFSPVFWAQRVS